MVCPLTTICILSTFILTRSRHNSCPSTTAIPRKGTGECSRRGSSMSSKDPGERRRRRSGVSRRKQLSKHCTSAKLWLADEQVLQEFVARKKTSPGQLLRDIVH